MMTILVKVIRSTTWQEIQTIVKEALYQAKTQFIQIQDTSLSNNKTQVFLQETYTDHKVEVAAAEGGIGTTRTPAEQIQNPDANVHYQEESVKQTGVNNDRDKAIIDKLEEKHNFNPRSFNWNPAEANFFVMKSYSEDNIHRSFIYSAWCSTENGNKKLDAAFKSLNGKGPVYLFSSVNASGHFCGLAETRTALDYSTQAGLLQDKWKGRFDFKWILIKDMPNPTFRHIICHDNLLGLSFV